MKKIKVIVKKPNEPVGHIEEVSSSLTSLQELVGGYITAVSIADGVSILCDEEGLIRELPANCYVKIKGTLVVIGTAKYNFSNCPWSLETWKEYLDRIN